MAGGSTATRAAAGAPIEQDGGRRPRPARGARVVQHQQRALLLQRRRRVERRAGARSMRGAGSGGDGGSDQARVRERREIDPDHAAGQILRHRLGDGVRNARLPTPAGPVTVTSRTP
jgi:hypothetical protein